MHPDRPPTFVRRPIKDPLGRSISAEFGRRILALRMEARISRAMVHKRTGIYWKRIRQLEEGWAVAALDEIVRVADLYGVKHSALVDGLIGEAKRGKKTLKSAAPKCLCDKLGREGRACLRRVTAILSPHLKRKRRKQAE
jgi:hypothetical protein